MPYGIPEGFGVITWEWRASGTTRPMIHQCGYEGGSAPDVTEANNLMASMGANWLVYCSVDYDLVSVHLLQNIGGDFFEATSTDEPIGGTNTDAGTTCNTAILVRKRTGEVGRKKNGRMYVPGLGEESLDTAGNLVGDVITLAEDIWGAIYNDIQTQVGTPYLLHTPVEGGPDPAPTLITSFEVDEKAVTQRRRMRG